MHMGTTLGWYVRVHILSRRLPRPHATFYGKDGIFIPFELIVSTRHGDIEEHQRYRESLYVRL